MGCCSAVSISKKLGVPKCRTCDSVNAALHSSSRPLLSYTHPTLTQEESWITTGHQLDGCGLAKSHAAADRQRHETTLNGARRREEFRVLLSPAAFHKKKAGSDPSSRPTRFQHSHQSQAFTINSNYIMNRHCAFWVKKTQTFPASLRPCVLESQLDDDDVTSHQQFVIVHMDVNIDSPRLARQRIIFVCRRA